MDACRCGACRRRKGAGRGAALRLAGLRPGRDVGAIAAGAGTGTVPPMTTTSVDDRQPSMTDLVEALEAATDPLDHLRAITELRAVLSGRERQAVRAARARGTSWAVIGESLGVSKQAASKRHGPPIRRSGAPPPERASTANPRQPRRMTTQAAGWEVTLPGGRPLLRVRPVR